MLPGRVAGCGQADFAKQLRQTPVVIFGAGNLGRRLLAGLRDVGIRPIAFADNNESLWEKSLESIEILDPREAARRFGADAISVMATWRPATSGGLRDLERQLRGLGCRHVVPFPRVFWSFPNTFLPYYLWDDPALIEAQQSSIRFASQLFAEKASRELFAAQLKFRATASSEALPDLCRDPQYFPDFLERIEDEHFIDCGAYNGDTIAEFLGWTGGRFEKITAFEADPACFAGLNRFRSGHPELAQKLVCHQAAVTAETGVVRFNASGNAAASIADEGIEVRSVRLDDMLRDQWPTFLKMDIEGAEPDALRGASEVIRRCEPVLAICVYHAQDHLWKLPLLMRELFPSARYFLRTYCLDGLDTVCYAIPQHRVKAL
jgi:FkbM family methyltransferase